MRQKFLSHQIFFKRLRNRLSLSGSQKIARKNNFCNQKKKMPLCVVRCKLIASSVRGGWRGTGKGRRGKFTTCNWEVKGDSYRMSQTLRLAVFSTCLTIQGKFKVDYFVSVYIGTPCRYVTKPLLLPTGTGYNLYQTCH